MKLMAAFMVVAVLSGCASGPYMRKEDAEIVQKDLDACKAQLVDLIWQGRKPMTRAFMRRCMSEKGWAQVPLGRVMP